MAIESRIYACLTSSSTLVGVCGTSIYPLRRVQDASTPSITYARVGGDRLYHMGAGSGYSEMENPHYEFSIYSTSLDHMRVVGGLLLGALSSALNFTVIALTSPADTWDDEVSLYVRTYDVSIWNAE